MAETTNAKYSRDEFTAIFADATLQAATALGATLGGRPAGPGDKLDFACAGVVGFVGVDIKGAFTVALTGDGASNAEMSDSLGMVLDSAGEYANQLAGRVKNILSGIGVTFAVSPPITLQGEHLSLAVHLPVARVTFKRTMHSYCILAVLEIPPPIEFLHVGEPQASMAEGSLLLF